MFEELAAELEELLAVDVAALPVLAAGEHVARLKRAHARLDARVLDTLAEFEESQAWRLDASYSVVNWLQAQVGTSKADARRQMRLTQHLRDMPATAAALRAGQITTEHARVLAWCVANPRTSAAFVWAEAGLVDEARRCDADALANRVRSWMEMVDQDGPGPRAPDPDRVYASRVGDRVKLDGDLGLDTGVPRCTPSRCTSSTTAP